LAGNFDCRYGADEPVGDIDHLANSTHRLRLRPAPSLTNWLGAGQ